MCIGLMGVDNIGMMQSGHRATHARYNTCKGKVGNGLI